ncbi:unnamed protein product [Prorocentrum cordatum]|uniref:Uncharacterized protein n=1 Tax=Prorocentrum cordatum TaxID=2364126 RepID=A0ABN9WSZ8_9DINO|nr:unnamed protein product [Polarella glacialis]
MAPKKKATVPGRQAAPAVAAVAEQPGGSAWPGAGEEASGGGPKRSAAPAAKDGAAASAAGPGGAAAAPASDAHAGGGGKPSSAAVSTAASLEDYISVIVAPKMNFQLRRRPEWKEIQDISQEDLRQGFMSRFPPAFRKSSDTFSFRPALPLTAAITEETTSLVFKLVSDKMPDDRAMLSILREMEKSYEGILRKSLSERSEALQDQFVFQEEIEEAQREQEKQLQALRKDNSSLRGQLQSVQKRLFLLEQEKDQLRTEQQHAKDREGRLERRLAELARGQAEGQDELARQVEALRRVVEAAATPAFVEEASALPGGPAPAAAAPPPPAPSTEAPSPAASEAARPRRRRWADESSEDAGDEACPATACAACQTDAPAAPGEEAAEDAAALARRVEALHAQMAALQGWLLQGSGLLGAAAPQQTAPP